MMKRFTLRLTLEQMDTRVGLLRTLRVPSAS